MAGKSIYRWMQQAKMWADGAFGHEVNGSMVAAEIMGGFGTTVTRRMRKHFRSCSGAVAGANPLGDTITNKTPEELTWRPVKASRHRRKEATICQPHRCRSSKELRQRTVWALTVPSILE